MDPPPPPAPRAPSPSRPCLKPLPVACLSLQLGGSSSGPAVAASPLAPAASASFSLLFPPSFPEHRGLSPESLPSLPPVVYLVSFLLPTISPQSRGPRPLSEAPTLTLDASPWTQRTRLQSVPQQRPSNKPSTCFLTHRQASSTWQLHQVFSVFNGVSKNDSCP